MLKFALFLLFWSFFFTSCETPDIKLTIARQPKEIVVEGILVDGLQSSIWVGQTAEVGEGNLTFKIPVDEVTVMIYENGELLYNLSPVLSDTSIFAGGSPLNNQRYVTDSVVNLLPGSIYQLVVEATGFTPLLSREIRYDLIEGLAETSLTTVEEFIGTDCVLSNLQMEVLNSDISHNFWMSSFSLNSPESVRLFGQSLFERFIDRGESKTLEIIVRDGVLSCNVFAAGFRIIVIAAPADYTEFYDQKTSAEYDLGGLFSFVPELPHNVTGGYGYFGLGSSVVLSQ